MKALMQQYGSTVIAVLTALLLIAAVMQLHGSFARTIPQDVTLCREQSRTFEQYWRSR